jgi:hypothetical protein
LSASIEEASNRVAASDAAGALDFARRLGEYQSLLVSATPMNPANGAGEVFARFADGLIPRSPGSSTLATPVTWLTKLAVDVSAPVLDLGESGTANVTITLRVEGDSKSPSLRLSSIPAPLRVEHNGKLLTAGEALSGKQFELKVSVPRGVDLPEKLELRGEGMMQANGNNVAEPVLISVTMPSASRFELQPLAQTEIVRTIRDGDRERLALLAFPKRLTNFSLGVKQVSGATGPLRAALYALNEPVPGEQLPSTFDDLQARATRLDVQVAVADQGAVRPIKFLPTAPPAAPPTTPPAPPAAPTPSGPVALPSKYLAVVLDEMEGEAVAKRHIEWLEIEPLHPNRFVETPTPQIVIGSGQRKIEVPIQAKATVEGTVAIPDEGVPFALTGSEAFADVDMTQASGSLKRARPLKPKLNLPEPDVDARGARLALAVASYPRAFMWNVDSEGGIIEPFRGARVEIRSPVEAPAGEPPLSLPPDQPIPLALEVDSDDQDCEVEVELRLLELDRDPNDFDFDPSAYTVVENVKLRGTRQVRNTLTVGETGALGITSEVGDFQFALPSTGSQGHAEIFARVVDPSGQSPELTSDRVRFVLDGAPPVVEGLANENDELLDHVIDKPLAIRIRVTDRLSGPKSLLYWLDREPQSMAGAFVPPGVEAKLEPDLSETPNFTERDFTVLIERTSPFAARALDELEPVPRCDRSCRQRLHRLPTRQRPLRHAFADGRRGQTRQAARCHYHRRIQTRHRRGDLQQRRSGTRRRGRNAGSKEEGQRR